MGEELSAPVERRRLECVRRCSCPRAKVGGDFLFLGELLDVVF